MSWSDTKIDRWGGTHTIYLHLPDATGGSFIVSRTLLIHPSVVNDMEVIDEEWLEFTPSGSPKWWSGPVID